MLIKAMISFQWWDWWDKKKKKSSCTCTLACMDERLSSGWWSPFFFLVFLGNSACRRYACMLWAEDSLFSSSELLSIFSKLHPWHSPSNRVLLNISGKFFETITTTLSVAGRDSMLRAIIESLYHHPPSTGVNSSSEYFFGRNPTCFSVLLGLLHSSKLHRIGHFVEAQIFKIIGVN